MNDFTKEELIEIKIALQDKEINYKYEYGELINKIQSLIDNYCEHENINSLGDVPGYQCAQCKEYLTDE